VRRIKWLDGVLNPLVPPGGVAQKRNYYSLWRIGLLRLAVRGDSGRVLDSEAKQKLVSIRNGMSASVLLSLGSICKVW
jgi:hypothetical protein